MFATDSHIATQISIFLNLLILYWAKSRTCFIKYQFHHDLNFLLDFSVASTITTQKPVSRFRFANKKRPSFFGSTTAMPKITTASFEEGADQTLESSNQASHEEDPLNSTTELAKITDVLQELQQAPIRTLSSTRRPFLNRGN